MAAIKIISDGYKNMEAVEYTISYVLEICKCESGYCGCIPSFSLFEEEYIREFLAVKKVYHKMDGKQVRQVVICFEKTDDVIACDANSLAVIIARGYGEKYQTVYAVHEDKSHVHIHFIINTVSYVDGRRFDLGPGEYTWLQSMVGAWMGTHHVNVMYDPRREQKYGY